MSEASKKAGSRQQAQHSPMVRTACIVAAAIVAVIVIIMIKDTNVVQLNSNTAENLPAAQSTAECPSCARQTALDALRVSVQGERPDKHCDKLRKAPRSSRRLAMSNATAYGDDAVWECRKKMAKQAVRDWCLLEETLKVRDLDIKEYRTVKLNIPRYNGTPVNPGPIDIAVMSASDFVSIVVIDSHQWEWEQVAGSLNSLVEAKEALGGKQVTLLDIGANLGIYAFSAAMAGFEVIAFEASSRNQAAMYRTLCLNPDLEERITLFPYALSDIEETCTMWVLPANSANGNLYCGNQVRHPSHTMKLNEIHTVRLGDYMKGQAAEVLKIDVEGHEPQVLKGAGDVIKNHVRYAAAEVNPSSLDRRGLTVEMYLDQWEKAGLYVKNVVGHPEVDATNRAALLKYIAATAPIEAGPGGMADLVFHRHEPLKGASAKANEGAA